MRVFGRLSFFLFLSGALAACTLETLDAVQPVDRPIFAIGGRVGAALGDDDRQRATATTQAVLDRFTPALMTAFNDTQQEAVDAAERADRLRAAAEAEQMRISAEMENASTDADVRRISREIEEARAREQEARAAEAAAEQARRDTDTASVAMSAALTPMTWRSATQVGVFGSAQVLGPAGPDCTSVREVATVPGVGSVSQIVDYCRSGAGWQPR